jgi:hypothetical protein
MGRPSSYTPELADEIVERLSEGEPLASICRDEHMPAVRTVSDWKEAHPSFSADFARAREEGEDYLAAECLEIADDGRRDYHVSDDGREVVDHDHIQRSKLRIETRLKLLAKWNPKKYGDRLTHAGDAEAPVQVEHSGTVALAPSDAYLKLLNGG